MPNERNHRQLAARIVGGYLRHNEVAADHLSSLISTVHQALSQLGQSPSDAITENRTPAVSVKRSVTKDHVVCLDCGWKGQMLKRHLTAAHGLEVEQYRARWSLKADHPITALGYSERRSTMAKQLGLGLRGQRAARPAAAAQPAPRRRGRPRLAATTSESA
jgi:predicted transcriptional regulator